MNKPALQLSRFSLLSLSRVQSSSAKVFFNLGNRIITAFVALICVPVYVKLIGVESYGLVAFYATLSGALIVLDLGLSTAINRQVAILNVTPDSGKDLKDLVFSIELIYWGIAIVVGLLIIFLSEPIALYWVKSKSLPVSSIRKAVMLMGVIFAFQFPFSIYDGIMIGLQKQVPNAILSASFSIVKALGVILALKFISATVECYFIWQAVVTLVFTVLIRYLVKSYLTHAGENARFSKEQLKSIRHFAAGMTGISLITFFLGQADKIVVSKLVLLEFVGYYNLAFLLASIPIQIVSPLQNVIFPKFTALVSQNMQTELVSLYHKGCRWIAIVIFPVGFVMIFFAKDILLLWTKNPTLSEYTAPMLRTFTIGSMCNCLMWMPYFFMLAKGNTRFTIYQNIIASVILVPLLFWWTNKYGAFGASLVWLCVNVGYILFSLPLFYHFFLRGELFNWIKKDTGLPFLASAFLILAAKSFQLEFMSSSIDLAYFLLLILSIGIVYLITIPELRNFIRSTL